VQSHCSISQQNMICCPVWNATPAVRGTGETIAIVSRSDVDPSDATSFWTLFGLDGTHESEPTLVRTFDGPNPGKTADEVKRILTLNAQVQPLREQLSTWWCRHLRITNHGEFQCHNDGPTPGHSIVHLAEQRPNLRSCVGTLRAGVLSPSPGYMVLLAAMLLFGQTACSAGGNSSGSGNGGSNTDPGTSAAAYSNGFKLTAQVGSGTTAFSTSTYVIVAVQ
jgi:hypothetical protein